jgi:hypothetical protein
MVLLFYSAENTRYEPGTSGVEKTVEDPSGVPANTRPVNPVGDFATFRGFLKPGATVLLLVKGLGVGIKERVSIR